MLQVPVLSWRTVGLLVFIVALVSIGSAAGVHDACVNPGPPVARPEPGTARAGYCAATHAVDARWLLLAVAPALLALLAIAVVRRRSMASLVVAALFGAAVVTNFFVADSLTFAYTI
jgi:hypothetical protein